MKEAKYIHGFWLIPGISYQHLVKMRRSLGSLELAWWASEKELELAGLTAEMRRRIVDFRSKIDVDGELESLWIKGVKLVGIDDLDYPESLKEINDPPLMLYWRGNYLKDLPSARLAIVGTRRPSKEGADWAYGLAKRFSEAGGLVISGLALGIDGQAHKGALEAEKPNIAVLATGVNKITPGFHQDLARKVLEDGGAIISEYPECNEEKIIKMRFLERNRIISGLAAATVIIEAPEKSGALVTARLALEQNRQVFAVPGWPGKIMSKGPNKLIKENRAELLDNFEQILNFYNLEKQKLRPLNLSLNEMQILGLLEKNGPMNIENFLAAELDFSEIILNLTNLEINGVIRKNWLQKWELI